MTVRSLKRCWLIGVLALVFLRELSKSSWAVAKTAFAKSPGNSPAIIAVAIDLKTDFGIAMLANLVSLTPGTTSLHVSEDRKTLYVHCLDAPDVDDVVDDIKHTFETRIAEIEA